MKRDEAGWLVLYVTLLLAGLVFAVLAALVIGP